jgi:putative CocE/NonD family hydrolase
LHAHAPEPYAKHQFRPPRSFEEAMQRILAAVLTCAALLMAAPAADAAVQRWGYIPVDGAELRYTVELPAPDGRFPVALVYDGYCEGTAPLACNDIQLAKRLLAEGYAVLGVSIRGTGCSTGTFDLRAPHEAADGAAVVRWAAQQPWSTGRVGMFGDSFPALTQPGVAALRPEGLKAIAPFQLVDDVYRDVGYPGGIMNVEFGTFWAGINQPAANASGTVAGVQQGDPQCAATFASAQPTNLPHNIAVAALQHQYFDDFWKTREVGASASRIDVPVFGCVTWQDDEVGSRPAWTLFPRIKPSLLWLVGANGYHSQCEVDNTLMLDQVVRFFDRYVRGVKNGWEKTPRVQLWHETYRTTKDGVPENVPGWVTTHTSWPPRTDESVLFLRDGGRLAEAKPAEDEAADAYVAPAASAGNEEGVVFGQSGMMWSLPEAPGQSVDYTTDTLAKDVEILGPASLDLWLSSTSVDTDLQATVTEVRPDGQETYVARGWLRASMRKLDDERSTPTFPEQTMLESDLALLTPGTPVHARVAIFPFNHVFRAGSAIRVIVDSPSQTGGWGFAMRPTAAVNSILHDREHPSRIVFGEVPGGRARGPLPACGTLLNQPCRTSRPAAP